MFKPVHVKTLAAQEQRMLLTSRKLVQRKLIDIESDMRGTLRNFGLKVGVVSTIDYETRIRHLVEGFPRLAAIVEPLLTVRRVMRQQLATLHKMLLDTVRHDPVCKRLMTAPGVGPVVALTYRASIDQPQRFVHSRAVGAVRHCQIYGEGTFLSGSSSDLGSYKHALSSFKSSCVLALGTAFRALSGLN
ncbi:transposase [Sphingomonas sp. 10B4]|uniref:transposase n=1 Tax=Sphingomonas sp. 10B4 TaxID=3048575 RepID=UPI003A0FFEAB